MKKSVDKVSKCGTICPYQQMGIAMSNETKVVRSSYSADYYQDNKDRYAHYAAKARDKIREEMVEAYGGKCVKCGIDNIIVLTLDHIFDDSEVEKELYGLNARGGHKHYQRLKTEGWPKDRFQLLCYNCNAIKEHARRRSGIVERHGDHVPADRVLVQARIGLKRNNSSGLKGVFWNSHKDRWHVKVTVNYKVQHIGFFVDPWEAAMAYRETAKKLWGDEANLQSDEEIHAAIAMMNSSESKISQSAEDLDL